MTTLQLLSNSTLPKEIKLEIFEDAHANDAMKIAKLAIKVRTTSTAKSGGDKKAENAKKIEDFAKEKYLLNKEWHELKSASSTFGTYSSISTIFCILNSGQSTFRQIISTFK